MITVVNIQFLCEPEFIGLNLILELKLVRKSGRRKSLEDRKSERPGVEKFGSLENRFASTLVSKNK